MGENARFKNGHATQRTTTVILIQYSGGKKNTTVVKHYGRVSETPCFPGEKSPGDLHR